MKIQVTEKHIKEGKPEHCTLCAVALAVQEKVGQKYSVSVMANDNGNYDGYYFSIYHKQKDYYKKNKVMDNERKLTHFIHEFDYFGYNKEKQQSIPCPDIVDAKPFEFELEIK